MDEVFSIESSSSYFNAFNTAKLNYYDSYAKLIMDKLDLDKIRSGEPKYLIRELYSIKYPNLDIPDKIPIPRPVDYIFKKWDDDPTKEEFEENMYLNELSGNQKWQLWCDELFLNLFEK